MGIGRGLLKSVNSVIQDRKYHNSIWEQIYLSDWFDPFFKVWNFLTTWDRTRRFLYWGWAMRNSYDFDAGTVYPMLKLKYKRIAKVLETNDRHVCTARHLKRLKLIIALLERIEKDEYLQNALAPVEARWGEMKLNLVKSDAGYSTLGVPTFSKAARPGDDKIAHKQWGLAAKHSDYMEKQDKELVWKLITRWNDYFWD